MRKRTLYFAFFLFAFSSQAQSYVPFPTDTTTFWRESGKLYQTSSYASCFDYYYQINGDTLINGKRYYHLHKYGIERELNNFNCGKLVGFIDKNAGYFRNDTLQKKVWYQNPAEGITKDTLLYDFNLSVGDTLPPAYNLPFSYGSSFYFVVDSIDSIQLNGRLRRRFFIDNLCYYKFEIIEGIGSTVGLLFRDKCTLYEVNKLYCLSSKGRTIYPDSTTSCNLVTGNEKQAFKKEKRLEIYPNPTNGKVVLQSEIQFQKIRVYNLQGQKVQEINPNEKSWELPHPKGLYLIRLQDNKGRNYLEKVLKQ